MIFQLKLLKSTIKQSNQQNKEYLLAHGIAKSRRSSSFRYGLIQVLNVTHKRSYKQKVPLFVQQTLTEFPFHISSLHTKGSPMKKALKKTRPAGATIKQTLNEGKTHTEENSARNGEEERSNDTDEAPASSQT